MSLDDDHRRELESSAIDATVIAERGYQTLREVDRTRLAAVGISVRTVDAFPGLLLPMFRATGEPISYQFKPLKPITIKNRTIKYLSPRAQSNHIDVHPRNRDRITDISVPLWITEGLKKADSLTSRGCCVVALTGVFNWRSKLATLGDWEDIPIKGRVVFLCFDSDARKNMNVARAMVRLGRWLHSKGAKAVQYLIVPATVNEANTKGVDDYFAAGGTLEGLLAVAATTEPDTEAFDGAFSDTRLADTVADDVFADRFVWCKALGWLKWTGKRWRTVTENHVGEAVRRYSLRRFSESHERGDHSAMRGWRLMLKASRQTTVLNLAKGIIEREADEFDSEPDLLNTPTGIVDLRSAQVQPHDPDLLLTKITLGSYREGYSHPDWDHALGAVREDARDWLKARIGQAITGHTTPDGVILIAQGSGDNGKTTVLSAIVKAFGDYAAPCSPKLIAAKDEHSTERADLRGQRFIVAEELTENRALNVTAIKQIMDVVQIKARHVHKDNQTFDASHSLAITTNYIPVVNETDHGTWRRLALLVFPFVYCKPGGRLLSPNDRPGDPTIKTRLKSGRDGQFDAIVSWAVDGARRFYESGWPLLPPSVEHDTRAWRKAVDRILAFWDERLIADDKACIVTTDMLHAFNVWMKGNGHGDWSKELFGSRFTAHEETKRHHVEERRPRNLGQLEVSRPPHATDCLPERPRLFVGVRFRAADETGDKERDDEKWSERSDPVTKPQENVDQEHFMNGSDRSDRTCCNGGPIVLACKVCPESPTYWRNPALVGVRNGRNEGDNEQ